MVVGCRLSVVGAALLMASTARAAGDGGGAYGRFEGDASMVVGVDGGIAGGRKLVGGDLRLRYLDTAGIALGYEELDALSKGTGDGDWRRDVRAGVELRPFFPARFLKNHETGTGFVDLFADSFGLDVGAIWTARTGSSVQRPGMYAGLAVEVPLAARASGAWIRIATSYRWAATRLEGESDPGGRVFAVTIGLAWHEFFLAHIVDRHDPHLR
jgi:hypothetical protein